MSRRHTGISWEQVHGKKKVKPFFVEETKEINMVRSAN